MFGLNSATFLAIKLGSIRIVEVSVEAGLCFPQLSFVHECMHCPVGLVFQKKLVLSNEILVLSKSIVSVIFTDWGVFPWLERLCL